LALIVVISLVVSGLMKFVIPQFNSVLQEMMGSRLPPATRWLLAIYRTIGDSLWWVILAAVLMGAITLIVRWWRPRRPDRPGPLSQMADLIRWHLPILHWFERNRSMVQTVDGLRMALASGSTVDQAIANTLHLDTNLCFRRRLKTWLAAVQQGQDVAVAAIRSRLAPALAWAFDTRVNQGNTPAVLEMIESFYRSNYSYQVNLARLFLWPSVTVMMACVVGFVAYAIFSPMVAVINSLVGYIP
jgi:type II secretory pathway component PulF